MAVNICLHCKKEYYVKPSRKEVSKYCSLQCKGFYLKQVNKGTNNPNFGKKWPEERKKKQSQIVKLKVDEEYRRKSGSANRGKKFDQDRIDRMHSHRRPESYGMYGKAHSPEVKKIIGQKSKEKFTDDFKKRYRKTMEARGYWLPLSSKTDYEIYFRQSDWIDDMYDIMLGKDKRLLEKHGKFSPSSNTRGVVRDHKLSRRTGFELGIFPEIMRHVENCEIILHADNVKKNFSKKINSDSITCQQLFDRIKNSCYNNKWIEHQKCLLLIKEYENGKRWTKKEG